MKRLLFSLGAGLVCLVLTSPGGRADQFGSQTTYTPPSAVSHLFDSQPDAIYRGTISDCTQPGGTIFDPAYRIYGKSDSRCDCSCRPSKCVQFYGWIEAGVYTNSRGNTVQNYDFPDRRGDLSSYHVPFSGNSSTLGKVHSTDFQMNQLWFGAKKDLSRYGFDWGFKAEVMFGTDGSLAQSFGDAAFDYGWQSKDYYAAIPQLYFSLGYEQFSVKIGKFETLLGVEHLQAPDSFFYSRSHLFYAEPQSHTGALFEYRASDRLWFNFGYVTGADTTFRNQFDDNGIVAGMYWRPCDPVTVWYTFQSTDRGPGLYGNGDPHAEGSLYQHTVALNWDVTRRLKYTFQWDFGRIEDNFAGTDSRYYGIANYLTYDINRRLAIGLRADWIHSNGVMEFSGFGRPNTGFYIGDLASLTLGLNWRPCDRLSIRPEIRYDHAGDVPIFDGGTRRDQFSAGIGAVYQF